MGCTHSTPPHATTTTTNRSAQKQPRESQSLNKNSSVNSLQGNDVASNSHHSPQPRDSLDSPRQSSNRSMGSALRMKKNMSLVWVNDDLNLKAHLAKVNRIADLQKKYELGPILGEGMTGTVSLCKSKPEGVVCALKSLNVSKMDDSQLSELRAEVSMLKQLDSPCIISLREVFESESTICIIMEYCNGGDLSQRDFPGGERQIAGVLYQVLKGVAHCHKKNICHRDLKLENVMFLREDSDKIRIIDFGLSKVFGKVGESFRGKDSQRIMSSLCGTVFYFAPEMLVDRCYSEKADIWAVGVMAHMLLTGAAPFQGATEQETILKIKSSTQVAFDSPLWANNALAKDFTQKLLCFDAQQRLSAEDALRHPWLRRVAEENMQRLRAEDGGAFLRAVKQSILRFSAYPVLKQAALMIVVHRTDAQTTELLQDLFLALDRGGFGMLSFEDFAEFMCEEEGGEEEAISREQCRMVFDKINQDKSSYIDCMEFLSASIESRMVCTDQFWRVAFGHLDVDDSGGISVEDVLDLLGAGFTESDATQIMRSATEGQGDTLREAEFLRLMDQTTPTPSPLLDGAAGGARRKKKQQQRMGVLESVQDVGDSTEEEEDIVEDDNTKEE